MNQENYAGDVLGFGDKVLGMQGISAARAQQYRAEMETLLEHRLSRHERWGIGLQGVFVAALLIGGGIAMSSTKNHPEYVGFDEARWMIATACALTGLMLGGWLLRVALLGGYARRAGDRIGLAIVVVFCGGWGAAFIVLAFGAKDAEIRMKLLATGIVVLTVLAGCLLMALLQWMHRQTQERLMRVEYFLAELLERGGSHGT